MKWKIRAHDAAESQLLSFSSFSPVYLEDDSYLLLLLAAILVFLVLCRSATARKQVARKLFNAHTQVSQEQQ